MRSTTTKGVYIIDWDVLPRDRPACGRSPNSCRAPGRHGADAEAVRAAREERDATLAEIRRLERNIDEIERSIDTAPTHDPSALSPADTPPLKIGESR